MIVLESQDCSMEVKRSYCLEDLTGPLVSEDEQKTFDFQSSVRKAMEIVGQDLHLKSLSSFRLDYMQDFDHEKINQLGLSQK